MMPSEVTTRHITLEAVADYFEGRLPDAQEGEIETHFAECEQCTNRARQYYAFTALWNGWTARAHGEAYRRAVRRT